MSSEKLLITGGLCRGGHICRVPCFGRERLEGGESWDGPQLGWQDCRRTDPGGTLDRRFFTTLLLHASHIM